MQLPPMKADNTGRNLRSHTLRLIKNKQQRSKLDKCYKTQNTIEK